MSSDRELQRMRLIDFLQSVARPGSDLDSVEDDRNLIATEIMDSFALIQVISYLEENYDLNLQRMGIDPADLSTIGGMLSVISRAGE